MGLRSSQFVAIVALVLWTIAISSQGASVPKEAKTIIEDAAYWHKGGMSKLKKMLSASRNTDACNLKARNIIIFVGDGMGLTTITAGRIFKGQQNGALNGEEASLVFDDFPHTGLAKTYNVDKQVPDSAGTATALFCGVKTLYGVIGLDATRDRLDRKKGRTTSIMDWAQSVGKRTGIVTTTRITHATPAATYAGIYDRDWECDSKIPADVKEQHIDIARQLIEENPGRQMNVILGGGLKPLGNENISEVRTVNFTGDTEEVCARNDGRNLTDEWLRVEGTGMRQFVQNREQLMNIDTRKVDHLLGLFRNNHLTYTIAAEDGEPRLKDMVIQTINILERSDSKGYVLMVEGGRIDQAHHQNNARSAMYEMLEFDKAVDVALRMTNSDETLIIVTADHSHSMTFNGYPLRGNDILGFANKTEKTVPYETLTYANGPGYDFHRKYNSLDGSKSSNATWIDINELGAKRLEPTYPHFSAFQLKDETHGGEDVIVFASGPGSSLIRGVFEQNYLAYVMSYVGCMGPAKDLDNSCDLQTKPLEKSGKQIFNPWIKHIILATCLLSTC